MTDKDLYIVVRRAVMMILSAFDKRYGVKGGDSGIV